jgi:hypothetical protein
LTNEEKENRITEESSDKSLEVVEKERKYTTKNYWFKHAYEKKEKRRNYPLVN